MRRAVLLTSIALASVVGAIAAPPAGAADECRGLRVCLPVAGPWVVVMPGRDGVEWELACPVRGYIVAGTDARLATPDVHVSILGRTGSPVGPGVTTGRSIVFHAVRASSVRAATSVRPFIGCIPSSGSGGRSLTAFGALGPGQRPSETIFSVVVTVPVRTGMQAVRATCPPASRLFDGTTAIGFDQASPPTGAQRASVSVRRTIVGNDVLVRVRATSAAGPQARAQVRALCTRVR